MSLSNASQHPATSGWLYNQQGGCMSDAAKEAFEEAVLLFKSSFTQEECERIWVQDKSGIGAVQQALNDAKARYDRCKKSKARKWLKTLSSRVMSYERVLDVLVGHHPEYVSLVWGAIKFVFIGVMNHEELIKELAKALCQIADALPRAELKIFLNPTDGMKQLVAALYAQIIKFVQRAVTWYGEGKAKHLFTAFTRPYGLRFKDLVDDIAETSIKVDRLALSMAMAELRETHLELQKVRTEQRSTHSVALEIRKTLEDFHALQYTGLLDTSRRVCEIQFSQILSFILSSPLATPEISRQFHTSRRNRRSRHSDYRDHFVLPHMPRLREWSSDSGSSLLAICGSFQTRHYVRDLAIDIIDAVAIQNTPVFWALHPGESPRAEYTSTDVLKHIVAQILQRNHALLNERSTALNTARFQSATMEKEWFSLLGSVLEGLPSIYIMIDLDVLSCAVATTNTI